MHLCDDQSTRIEGSNRSRFAEGRCIVDSSMLVDNLGVGVSAM